MCPNLLSCDEEKAKGNERRVDRSDRNSEANIVVVNIAAFSKPRVQLGIVQECAIACTVNAAHHGLGQGPKIKSSEYAPALIFAI